MKRILILLFALLNSCQPVGKILGGYSTPKPENKESLTSYMEKLNLPLENILVYKDSNSYKRKVREMPGYPEIRIFNKEGKMVFFTDTISSCTGPAEIYTQSLCTAPIIVSNPSKTIDTETKNLVDFNGENFVSPKAEDYDYFVIIYWLRCLGRLNKTKVREWENNLNALANCKVIVKKVNMDWQKKWDEKK